MHPYVGFKRKVLSNLEPLKRLAYWPITAVLISRFHSMKQLRVLRLPPEWGTSP